MAIGKRLVDDCYGRIGLLIGRGEESALAQACADGCKVVAAYVSDECNLVKVNAPVDPRKLLVLEQQYPGEEEPHSVSLRT
jgi:hypothetical protein